MFKLYEIPAEIEKASLALDIWAQDHDGDVTDCPALDQIEELQEGQEAKALAIGCLIKERKAEADAIRAEERNLAARRKVLENQAEHMKTYLTKNIEAGTKFSDSRCKIGWRKSQQVVVECDVQALPDHLQKIKVEADKTKIKAEIKAGTEVLGCDVIEKQNIQIG